MTDLELMFHDLLMLFNHDAHPDEHEVENAEPVRERWRAYLQSRSQREVYGVVNTFLREMWLNEEALEQDYLPGDIPFFLRWFEEAFDVSLSG